MTTGVRIECILKRKGGSKLHFDQWPNDDLPGAPEAPEADYHFAPLDPSDPNSPHVATVCNEHHIARFLSISHAYKLYGDNPHVTELLTNPRPAAKKAAVAATVAAKAKAKVTATMAAVVDPLAGAEKKPEPVAAQNTATADVPGADPEMAIEICNLSVKDLKAKINKYTDVDLRGALSREANSGDKPRLPWREVIEAHLTPPPGDDDD